MSLCIAAIHIIMGAPVQTNKQKKKKGDILHFNKFSIQFSSSLVNINTNCPLLITSCKDYTVN